MKVFSANSLKGVLGFSMLVGLLSCQQSDDADTKTAETKVIKVGHFPNVTHIQALVARNMARHGKGWFEGKVPGYTFEWYAFNAGPSAMEAIFGKTIDLVYVGPSPAINAYCVSQGKDIRILSGAVKGGAALLVQPDSQMKSPQDFKGKSIATPQLGNTQDISARAWFAHAGHPISLEGDGFCRILPTPNSMQVNLFRQKQLDAAWTVEPWVSYIEQDANGKLIIQDDNVITTVLAGRTSWLDHYPDLTQKIKQAHEELTLWILNNPQEAKKIIKEELSLLTQGEIPDSIIESAWNRLKLSNEIDIRGLQQFVQDAQDAGLLEQKTPDIKGIVYQ